MLVSALVVFTHRPATALIGAAVATFVSTAWISRLPVMRQRHAHAPEHTAKGLGPLKTGGFPALLVCVVALGMAFGAAGVIVPRGSIARADRHAEDRLREAIAAGAA